MQYRAKEFNIEKIDGISEKALEVHLSLYKGYVDNLNSHYSEMEKVGDNNLLKSALQRRISFELAGILNHERYFEVLVGGGKELKDGELKSMIEKNFGSFDNLINMIKTTSLSMRGIGWVLLLVDKNEGAMHITFAVDHELGNVNLPCILAVDMWEHSFMVDYLPSQKSAYVDSYINAVNWDVVEKIFNNS